MPMSETLKVGSTVWRYVEFRGLRPKVEDSFQALTITGETRVSWIADQWLKFPKTKPADEWDKNPDTRVASGRNNDMRVYLTRRAVDNMIWLLKNAIPLRRHFEGLLNMADLSRTREMAQLTGYKEAP